MSVDVRVTNCFWVTSYSVLSARLTIINVTNAELVKTTYTAFNARMIHFKNSRHRRIVMESHSNISPCSVLRNLRIKIANNLFITANHIGIPK